MAGYLAIVLLIYFIWFTITPIETMTSWSVRKLKIMGAFYWGSLIYLVLDVLHTLYTDPAWSAAVLKVL